MGGGGEGRGDMTKTTCKLERAGLLLVYSRLPFYPSILLFYSPHTFNPKKTCKLEKQRRRGTINDKPGEQKKRDMERLLSLMKVPLLTDRHLQS